MNIVGLDIGTNYTKATKDGRNVTVFPSIVVYGDEKDWSLKEETKKVYIGEEALAIVQSLENVEVLRPLHEGRLIHSSYLELARYALNKLNVKENFIISTGLPVKSSKREREQIVKTLESNLSTKVLIFPEPVGTLAYMGLNTGVCIDIGFGTTDVVVLSHMEYLKGDTMLIGVDKLYENLEVLVRNKIGISLTHEEMTKLLTIKDYEVGRVRSGRKISVSHDIIMRDYHELMKSWVDRISNRIKMLLEGVSTTIIENLVLTGGGSALPGVFEEFTRSFEDVGRLKKPDNPIVANSRGYYMLAKALEDELRERLEKTEEVKPEKIEKVEEKEEEKRGK